MSTRLANVLAVHLASTVKRAHCERNLRAAFPAVRTLESGWLVAERPLPNSPPSRCTNAEFVAWEGERELLDSGVQGVPIHEVRQHLSRVRGEVGFARFEPAGRFLAARSAGGMVPVYVARDHDAVWLATSMEDLVRHRELEPRFDALVLALWSEGNAAFPDNRTFFRGVRILSRGETAIGDPQHASHFAYWDPRPAHLAFPDQATIGAHIAEFREALMDALSETLSRDGTNLLTLSGGVDSSSIAYLARRLGFPLATLTFVAPHRSKARAIQLSYVEKVTHDLEIEHTTLVDAEDDALETLFERQLPALFFCPHPALRMLPELAPTCSARTLLSGHFADEVAGYSQRLQDWVNHTALWQLVDPRYPRPAGWRDSGRWLKRRVMQRFGHALLPFPGEVGPWFHANLRAEVHAWGERERRAALLDPRPLRELAAWCRLDGWLAMHWECCSRWGIRPSNPFFTRRMLELAFRCHPTELFGPGTKKILRHALTGLVPDPILQRTDKGHWNVVRRAPRSRTAATGLPDDIRTMLDGEYANLGGPLIALEHRALNQLMLFSRKVREVRHAAYGRD